MPIHTPTVTVIIPTYNRARVLGRAVQSVLDQTYEDFELIVVDDGSTDGTQDIVDGFHDNRLRYMRFSKNSGSPAAPTNAAINTATGKYIAILDSDDEWLPKKLEKQVDVLDNGPINTGIVYTDMWRVYEDGKRDYWRSPRITPQEGIVYQEALGYRVKYIGTQTLLLRAECFSVAGLFDETLPMYIDTELLMRMSKHYCLCHMAEPLVNFYCSTGSVSSSPAAAALASKLILEKHLEEIRRSRALLARHYYEIGAALYRSNDIRQSRGYFIKAILTYPPSVRGLLLALVLSAAQAVWDSVRQADHAIRRFPRKQRRPDHHLEA